MNPLLARHCDGCKQYARVPIIEKGELVCPHCQKTWGKVEVLNTIFEHCPICGCRQFYTSKDFNQLGGCLIILIGAVLVPWTYGLSLPVFALIDWLIYRKVPGLINCYRCATEFKDFKDPGHFKPFMHHIGLKYDKYR